MSPQVEVVSGFVTLSDWTAGPAPALTSVTVSTLLMGGMALNAPPPYEAGVGFQNSLFVVVSAYNYVEDGCVTSEAVATLCSDGAS